MYKKTIIEVAIDNCTSNGVKDGYNSIVCEDGYRMTLQPVFDGEINTGVDILVNQTFLKRMNYEEKDFFKKIQNIFSEMSKEHY